MVLEIQFWSVNYTLVARTCKTVVAQWCSGQKQYILGFKVNKTFWITFHTTKHYFSALLPVILWLFIKNGSHGWRASCIWTVNFKWLQEVKLHNIKRALLSLKQFLKIEIPLKMMKNALYFTLNEANKVFFFERWESDFRDLQ